jgi:hypothetical protein
MWARIKYLYSRSPAGVSPRRARSDGRAENKVERSASFLISMLRSVRDGWGAQALIKPALIKSG